MRLKLQTYLPRSATYNLGDQGWLGLGDLQGPLRNIGNVLGPLGVIKRLNGKTGPPLCVNLAAQGLSG